MCPFFFSQDFCRSQRESTADPCMNCSVKRATVGLSSDRVIGSVNPPPTSTCFSRRCRTVNHSSALTLVKTTVQRFTSSIRNSLLQSNPRWTGIYFMSLSQTIYHLMQGDSEWSGFPKQMDHLHARTRTERITTTTDSWEATTNKNTSCPHVLEYEYTKVYDQVECVLDKWALGLCISVSMGFNQRLGKPSLYSDRFQFANTPLVRNMASI